MYMMRVIKEGVIYCKCVLIIKCLILISKNAAVGINDIESSVFKLGGSKQQDHLDNGIYRSSGSQL